MDIVSCILFALQAEHRVRVVSYSKTVNLYHHDRDTNVRFYSHWDSQRPGKLHLPDITCKKSQPPDLRKTASLPLYTCIHSRFQGDRSPPQCAILEDEDVFELMNSAHNSAVGIKKPAMLATH